MATSRRLLLHKAWIPGVPVRIWRRNKHVATCRQHRSALLLDKCATNEVALHNHPDHFVHCCVLPWASAHPVDYCLDGSSPLQCSKKTLAALQTVRRPVASDICGPENLQPPCTLPFEDPTDPTPLLPLGKACRVSNPTPSRRRQRLVPCWDPCGGPPAMSLCNHASREGGPCHGLPGRPARISASHAGLGNAQLTDLPLGPEARSTCPRSLPHHETPSLTLPQGKWSIETPKSCKRCRPMLRKMLLSILSRGPWDGNQVFTNKSCAPGGFSERCIMTSGSDTF